ncbi:adenosine deaminase [Candidatus Bipolaricaulota bacterium]|nr:adenosine deaminase [Candidatus Bipolaricaulota bacterium]
MKRDLVYDLPKVDLHVHLDGSLRLGTVVELAQDLPGLANIRETVIPPLRCSLERYLAAFDITVAVLQTETSLTRAAYELCGDAAKENVIYMEIRFAPLLHLRNGLTPRQVVEAVLIGMRQAEKDYPIKTNLILCAMKQELPANSEKVARLAIEYHEKGVVGIDLAGPEISFPPIRHHKAVEIVRAAGLHVTIHAGEGCCGHHVKQAIDLGAERIGHGVYLYEDKKTEKEVAKKKIPLEICPTSNLQISGIMNSYADHPMKQYLDEGIPITLNTDNRLMSQIDVTHELSVVSDAFCLSWDEMKKILSDSVNAAFAPEDVKDHLRQVQHRYFDNHPF